MYEFTDNVGIDEIAEEELEMEDAMADDVLAVKQGANTDRHQCNVYRMGPDGSEHVNMNVEEMLGTNLGSLDGVSTRAFNHHKILCTDIGQKALH